MNFPQKLDCLFFTLLPYKTAQNFRKKNNGSLELAVIWRKGDRKFGILAVSMK